MSLTKESKGTFGHNTVVIFMSSGRATLPRPQKEADEVAAALEGWQDQIGPGAAVTLHGAFMSCNVLTLISLLGCEGLPPLLLR